MTPQPPPRSASEAMRRTLGPQVSGALARGIAQGQQRTDEPAVSGVSSEEAAANVTANVPVLAAAGLPAAEACTDPRHTGPIRAQLGCTGPDPAVTVEDTARRFARRVRAVELLCAGRPGYHAITVKTLLTAMGEADDDDQEQPPAAYLDPFTEAAVRRGALLGGADAIEALPQDYECDPGRGDAVKLLRRLAGLTATTEQPAGLTWEARAEHAVRLYATTAIELEDARAEIGRLRAERHELIEQRDRIANDTMAALTATELKQGQADADHLAAAHPDTIAALVNEIADDIPHRRASQIAAAYLNRHTRLLAEQITTLGQARGWSTWAAEYIHPDREFIDPGKHENCENCGHAAHGHAEHLTTPDALADCPQCPCADELREMSAEQPLAVPTVGDRYEKRATPDAGRIVTVSRVGVADSGRTAVAYDWRDDKPGECGSACPIDVFHRTYKAVEEQPLAFPQLAVPCPRCESPAGQLCTSHSGTRQRTNDTHQDRTRAYRATQAGR
ncbi:hypothetical protein ACIF6K_26630 [Streptomyces sp. NPDC085942]|uniref:zinc finger domain-containing protein n=1 Tax=Streptomyces sp. NPDC085942 TaxID=3365743 RepID=UPI0037D7B600